MHKCSTCVTQERHFIGMEINITMFNKNSHLFSSFEITINFPRQDSLPTHIQSIGRPISHN